MARLDYNQKFNLRLPNDLYKKVENLGKTYERSTNEQIVYMLKTWQEPSAFEDRFTRLEEQVFTPESSKQATGQ